MADAEHWNGRYASIGLDAVSWYEPTPTTSLELINRIGTPPDVSVLDVGGGASGVAEMLCAEGCRDVTVLDLSASALEAARARASADAPIAWIEADVLTWTPARTWDVWHDRAVLHFLLDETARQTYRSKLQAALAPGGGFVIGVFAEDGPDQCSGLPVRRYSLDQLVAFIADVEVVETRRQIHRTPSGAEQPFNWIAARLGRG